MAKRQLFSTPCQERYACSTGANLYDQYDFLPVTACEQVAQVLDGKNELTGVCPFKDLARVLIAAGEIEGVQNAS